ncbi:hypothetical protein PROFUN_03440 [Planoprotostelium fungivorum]|uniref:CBS domain-containing protein n=1 Tax=Planoprotostelium fungivorum TaxID=1890364 RepID=A0A2P6MN57_9EUKA|nr:hypothetical protein PROFUN_03440 [Planoprotostelium fungivorum]
MTEAAKPILKDTKIETLLQSHRELITIDSSMSVPAALKILVNNNIYGAPVVDSTTGHFYGFVDLIDVVTTIVSIFDFQGKSNNDDFYSLLEQVEQFDQTAVEQITDLSKRNPFCPILRTATLHEALQMIRQTGAHRMPVLDGQRLTNILTEFDIVNHVTHNLHHLGEFCNKTLADLDLGRKEVVTVYTDTPALEAFRLMLEKKISGLAVINREEGTLFSNLSARDIKLIAGEALFTKLFKTVKEFIQDVRSTSNEAYFPIVYVSPDAKIRDVMVKLVSTRMHRLYVVDESVRPVGVVSLGDLTTAVSEYENTLQ